MTKLLPVHRKEGTKIVEHNPQRIFVGYGPTPVVEQYGHYFNEKGVEMSEAQVPAAVIAAVKAAPKRSTLGNVHTSEVCDHCGEVFPTEELPKHLLEVVRGLNAASKPAVPGLDA
jgi:hypothetical protein